MFEGSENLSDNTVISGKLSTQEEANNYEYTRFNRRSRMKKLDRFEKDFAQQAFDFVGTDSSVVDVPCGNGRFFDILSNARQLTMIDYAETMLKATEERVGARENVQFMQADIASIDLPDNYADLCFCMRLFHHMKTDEVRFNALKELSRISKKYVALSFYNKYCVRYYWRKMLGKKIRGNYITFEHLAGLAKEAGLEPIERLSRKNFIEQQCLIIFKKA